MEYMLCIFSDTINPGINDVASGHPEFEISLWPEEGGEDESDNFGLCRCDCSFRKCVTVAVSCTVTATKLCATSRLLSLLTCHRRFSRRRIELCLPAYVS